MPRNQREWIKALEDEGWVRERGGKHQVKMVKPGKRPVTLPQHKGRTYSKGSMRQYGGRRPMLGHDACQCSS